MHCPCWKGFFWFPEKLATAHMALLAQWQPALHAEYQLGNLQKQLLQLSRSLGNPITHARVLMSHCHWGTMRDRSPVPEPRSSLESPRAPQGIQQHLPFPLHLFPPITEKNHNLLSLIWGYWLRASSTATLKAQCELVQNKANMKSVVSISGAQIVYKITINELILAEVPVVWSWSSHWLLLGTLRWWLFSKHWAAQPT